ncbi:MAG: hypothetical protein M9962_09570 [Oligoflexia bacterium]|nr:hypothetical protein [Oligoflexia bacterium]
MKLFRKKTLFHVEQQITDPDEIKLRFRRKILGLTIVFALLLLSIPVFRSTSARLEARSEARKFAEWFLSSKVLSSQNRTSISMHWIKEKKIWERRIHPKDTDCRETSSSVYGPYQFLGGSNEFDWNIKLASNDQTSMESTTLCIDPKQGLVINGSQVADTPLLVAVLGPEPESNSPLAYILLNNGGTSMDLLIK